MKQEEIQKQTFVIPGDPSIELRPVENYELFGQEFRVEVGARELSSFNEVEYLRRGDLRHAAKLHWLNCLYKIQGQVTFMIEQIRSME